MIVKALFTIIIINISLVLSQNVENIIANDESINKGFELEATTRSPVYSPTYSPTRAPVTAVPTRTAYPTKNPNYFIKPTFSPSNLPSSKPSINPTTGPTVTPTNEKPSISPSNQPTTYKPTTYSTQFPTDYPTSNPSPSPTNSLTYQPSVYPSNQPTSLPTELPSENPTFYPTVHHTENPTLSPSIIPTNQPSVYPTDRPSTLPTQIPTNIHTVNPSPSPSIRPTYQPRVYSSSQPTTLSTKFSSENPTINPTVEPTEYPTLSPTILSPSANIPATFPTVASTDSPIATTIYQTIYPITSPINSSIKNPTSNDPSSLPTNDLTSWSTVIITDYPSTHSTVRQSKKLPTIYPSNKQSISTTNLPQLATKKPTKISSNSKSTIIPIATSAPTTNNPTFFPSTQPSPLPNYTQYSDRLRITFDVTLRTSSIYGDTTCISFPETSLFAETYYDISVYDTTSTNWISDLEVYFPYSGEYIGNHYSVFANTKLADWPSSFDVSSSSPVNSSKQAINLTPGFNQICFANNCKGGCSNTNNYINEFIGYIDLYGISLLSSSISTASYIQYHDRLRINFDVTLRTTAIYDDTYCIGVIGRFATSSTYYRAVFYDTTPSNYLSDLEIYFPKSGEFIGSNLPGLATVHLAEWPSSFSRSSTAALDSGLLPINISPRFDEVCFANNCNSNCSISTNYKNRFVGYIDLYGIAVSLDFIYPTGQPTGQPFSSPTSEPTSESTAQPTSQFTK